MSRGTARSTMNIGRWRRAFSARSTAPRPMIGSVLAVQETMASNSCRRAGRSARRRLSAPKRPASFSPRSSVRLAIAMPWACGGKVRGHQLDHLAGADEQHLDVAQIFEQLRRQPHRGGRHADAVGADLGGWCALPWPPKAALEQLVQRGAQRAGFVGFAHRLLHLAQDLRLAQHHRIQPRGHAEGVAGGIAVLQHIGVVASSWSPGTPPWAASQSMAGVTSWVTWAGSAATYSSVRLQVDTSAASGTARSSSLRPRSAGESCSGENAKRPRMSTGAVVWFRPRVNTLMSEL
jgi:hypothetical protein